MIKKYNPSKILSIYTDLQKPRKFRTGRVLQQLFSRCVDTLNGIVVVCWDLRHPSHDATLDSTVIFTSQNFECALVSPVVIP